MPQLATQPAISSGDIYRRQARRLRGRWGGDPARLHRLLGDLARQTDAARQPPMLELPAHAVRDPMAARLFAASVAEVLKEGVLRYSQRQKLLRQARSMDIGRFEANLIIAMVQHQAGSSAKLTARRRSLPTILLLWIALLVEVALLGIGAL